MTMPLLATKLYLPPKRPNVILRPRLVERLMASLERKLTLVSAQAGFGKTTLVSEWVNGAGRPTAWLSLDKEDSEPSRFLAYFVSALQTLLPSIGEGLLTALQSPQPPPIESVMTTLVNEITSVANPFILVLDDYHLIDSTDIDEALVFLVEHLPPQMHLVIASREDPNLPLPRLRVRGQLTEVRAADLRFTVEETADFLNQAMGLSVKAEDVAALEARTEGWIAGLQLAALALQGEGDSADFIQSFSGSHRFVLDYMVEEVLQQQSEAVQTFLLKTAILGRLCGPLCGAVLGDSAVTSQEMLTNIEQANLFVVPLDNERRWYRYHHLFADLLQQRLAQKVATSSGEDGFDVNHLHQKASIWFEENGLALEAFHHAAAGDDIERAERLVEGEEAPLYFQGTIAPVLNWFKRLPKTIMDSRPSLWVIYASASTLTGHPSKVIEEMLGAAESRLVNADLPNEQIDDLYGRIAAIRAMLAITVNDGKTMLVQSKKALKHLHSNNLAFQSTVQMTLAYAYNLEGDRLAAKGAYQRTIGLAESSGNNAFGLAGFIGLAGIQAAENQLYQAESTYLHVLKEAGESPQPYVCAAYMGLTQIAYEWNDWEAVQRYGQLGIKYGLQLPSVDVEAVCQVYLARMKLMQGDLAQATAFLDEAERSSREKNLEHPLLNIAAVRVLLFLRQGQISAAERVIEGLELPLSRASVLLAQGNSADALGLVEPLRRQMAEKGWQDEWLKALVLEVVVREANGDEETAVQLLSEALVAAEPGGFVRIFVDEGPEMAKILTKAAVQGIRPNYIDKLLAAFEAETRPSRLTRPPTPTTLLQPLMELLSPRELEVLELIAVGLSNREIGERLFLALDTIKGHNRKIFGKLHVKKRTEAVARARELGLL